MRRASVRAYRYAQWRHGADNAPAQVSVAAAPFLFLDERRNEYASHPQAAFSFG
ncbi:hypothetical protein APY04_1211 [Hyphomicrobium sulfonivorans]|uniref:Uncharacterized protein n=1 Tax=Hyphomicrobium sulfonivorans TaxID=121290 RepID=A0A120CWV8_HYPSL|nr:hypothetical protein APY04_1211 [Hyphomicrobium sulfonivorans]